MSVSGNDEYSVVIPTCDRPNLLKRSLASAMRQSIPPAEVIIVDDGSTMAVDFSWLGVPFTQGSLKIRVLRNEIRKGANYSRNLGVLTARSDIVMFLDDDDGWLPSKAACQLRYFSDPNCVLVYSGKYMLRSGRVAYASKIEEGRVSQSRIFHGNYIGTTSGVAIRKKAFIDVGCFDTNLPALQDYDLWIRVSRVGNVVADGERLVLYSIPPRGGGNISSDLEKQKSAIDMIRVKYGRYLEKNSDAFQPGFNLVLERIPIKSIAYSSWFKAAWVALKVASRNRSFLPLAALAPEWLRWVAWKTTTVGGNGTGRVLKQEIAQYLGK